MKQVKIQVIRGFGFIPEFYGRSTIISLMNRPAYKDFLNQTYQTPSTSSGYPSPPSIKFNHPPMPVPLPRHSKDQLYHTMDLSNHIPEPTITINEDQSVLRDMKGLQRFNKARKNSINSNRESIDRLSGSKSDISPYKRAKKPKRTEFMTDSPSSNLLDPQNATARVYKYSGRESSSDVKKQYERKNSSKERIGNLSPYTPKKSYEDYSSHTKTTNIEIPRSPKPGNSYLNPNNYPHIERPTRPKTSLQGSKSQNCLDPIIFRQRQRSKSRDGARNRNKNRESEKNNDKDKYINKERISDKRTSESRTREKQIDYPVTTLIFQEPEGPKMVIDDFFIGKKLGEGRFGCVFMAVHKQTGGVFALKRVPKAMIKENMMTDQFALEVRIQAAIDHPNLVSVYAVFDDREYVYLLLEYLYGGALYDELKKRGKYEEKDAAERVEALCKAVQALHLKGVAHRDIKPENIMMCEGQCKLGDFGWATICDQLRTTYCGTTDYVSPQIVEGKEYGPCVDMWCIGIFTYELLAGRAPFYHLSRQETFKRIGEAAPTYPSSFSAQAVDFISGMLKKVPEERMSAPDALAHPFLTQLQSPR